MFCLPCLLCTPLSFDCCLHPCTLVSCDSAMLMARTRFYSLDDSFGLGSRHDLNRRNRFLDNHHNFQNNSSYKFDFFLFLRTGTELFDETNLLMFVNCFENIMPYLADSLIFSPSRSTTLHKQFFERMKGKGEYRSWSRS